MRLTAVEALPECRVARTRCPVSAAVSAAEMVSRSRSSPNRMTSGLSRKAARSLIRDSGEVEQRQVSRKGPADFVSEADRRAEEILRRELGKARPEFAMLLEESGAIGDPDSDNRWIVDPLDGTTNFLHGFPQFAVSIGMRHKGRLEHGVVYDPLRQEIFSASRGAGATLNDQRLRVTNRKTLEGSLLGTGFPFKSQQHLEVYLEMFRALFPQTAGIRRAGSAALDLAYVAAGRLDGFWEIGLSIWDMAAGVLLIQEAGGLCSDFSGGHDHLESGNIVAGNPKLFAEILKTIRPFVIEELR